MRWHRLLWLLVVLIFAAAGLGGYYLTLPDDRHVVYADGDVLRIEGQFDTVGDVLRAAGVELSAGDLLAPPVSAAAEGNTAIALQRPTNVNVTIGDAATRYTTHQTTLGGFLNEVGLSVSRSQVVLVDQRPIAHTDFDTTALPAAFTIRQLHTVTIHDGERQTTLRTAAATVGAALTEAGIQLLATDGVAPALDTWLDRDRTVTITRATPVAIEVDGRRVETRTYHARVIDILAEAGIALVGLDYAIPAPEDTIAAGGTIRVVRVTENFSFNDTPIPFETAWQATDQLEIDQTGLLVAGQDGIERERVRIRYENGVEVSRTVDARWVTREPETEIIGYGTRIVLRTVDTPEGPREYWRLVRMRVTSYTAASSGKPPDHPYYGITASGVPAGYGVVAIDPDVVPFRSDVFVPGYGVGFAGDTGGGVKGRWIDLGFDDDNYQSWYGYVDVYYLAPVPPAEDINFRIPTWLP